MPTEDDRLFSMLIYVLSFPFPVLGPLLIWLFKREESEFVDYHGKEYFNFLVSFTIYGIISGILVLILIGILMLIILGIIVFILTIVAAVKAYQGEKYRFPLTIHFVK
ncbi:DUF4870 domain-containing protein [Virgibacillus halodenitrificans]|jgi:uncharacterized protein|uniref:DUF4870 domain-containing protein n=2 Tax=Virgibacillus halodenitrificans TaxID=1482 RepID=UPI00045CD7A6|nr:DUF4870 domain-containing protein [Virgibacillus halodenitrificans]MYL46784.1 DUF4870 domain-containing protein [Virgibacillus halodenitrificans]MYL61282.1 DUF4870 domain-containing protein [Virgibacillus halodenitrificans]CDQ37162.1 putative membrane protein [Virgibacillus halodenitrificans]